MIVSGLVKDVKDRKARKVDFLDLSVKTRNRVITLFTSIKMELKKGYALRDIGVDVGSWDDLSLSEFMKLPKEYWLQIINRKPRVNVLRQDLAREVNALYAFLGK